ncbi:MAG: hypothetical protein ACTS8P_00015 [Arsenophonus sp. NC-XBC3-MAG3]
MKYHDSQHKQLVTIDMKADARIGKVSKETVPQKQGRSTIANILKLHNWARIREEATAKMCTL